MDIKAFLQNWIALSNRYDTEKYLDTYHKDAIINDPSVGRKFVGHMGIRDYFESYFIGYQTQTKIILVDIHNNSAHMEVSFTGTFPGGQINGMFDFIFKDDKIASLKADLM